MSFATNQEVLVGLKELAPHGLFIHKVECDRARGNYMLQTNLGWFAMAEYIARYAARLTAIVFEDALAKYFRPEAIRDGDFAYGYFGLSPSNPNHAHIGLYLVKNAGKPYAPMLVP